MKSLRDATVVINGASSGIGLATAQAFARPGANVDLAPWRRELLEEAARDCEALGGRVSRADRRYQPCTHARAGELIDLARTIREAVSRGEETGLTEDKVAFYDVLAQSESARRVMHDDTLKLIARELVSLRTRPQK